MTGCLDADPSRNQYTTYPPFFAAEHRQELFFNYQSLAPREVAIFQPQTKNTSGAGLPRTTNSSQENILSEKLSDEGLSRLKLASILSG